MEDNKKTVETINNRKMKMFQGFAQMMDAVWGNDNGTKGLEKFLEQNSSTPENEGDEDD